MKYHLTIEIQSCDEAQDVAVKVIKILRRDLTCDGKYASENCEVKIHEMKEV